MKKTCFFILPALVLFLCSSAFAHSAKELPTLDQDNPLSAVCTGSGVSLRAQPSSGGEKIATLDKDEELCLIGRQETKGIPVDLCYLTGRIQGLGVRQVCFVQ